MKTLKTLLPMACLLLLPLTAFAAPIAYPFRVTDNSGVLVAGATVAIGATTLTSGSATVTPAAAGEKMLATNAAPAATVSVTLLDYGTGDYALVYDPAVSGELYIPLTVSKSGSTITGGAALIALVASADSSTIVGVNTTTGTINTTTTGTNTLATGIKAKTDLVATNAMDSPNEIASQGQAGTTSTAVAALPNAAANATAVWGAAVKTITGGTVTTVTNPVTLPTTVPAGYGGSTGDTPGTTSILANYARRTDIPALPTDYLSTAEQASLVAAASNTSAATVTALLAASFITLPGTATTTGVGEVLTARQITALGDSVSGGDNVTSGPPVASGSATVTYYLRGQVHSSTTITEIATVNYDANKQQVSRTVKISQPFPSF